MADQKPIDKNLRQIRKGMENDIKATLNTADLLSGKGQIGNARLNSSKKVNDPFAKLDDPKNINKFLKFMESKYGKGVIKIELKKEKL